MIGNTNRKAITFLATHHVDHSELLSIFTSTRAINIYPPTSQCACLLGDSDAWRRAGRSIFAFVDDFFMSLPVDQRNVRMCVGMDAGAGTGTSTSVGVGAVLTIPLSLSIAMLIVAIVVVAAVVVAAVGIF